MSDEAQQLTYSELADLADRLGYVAAIGHSITERLELSIDQNERNDSISNILFEIQDRFNELKNGVDRLHPFTNRNLFTDAAKER